MHKILKFEQCDWMKKDIDFNTEKRKNAKNKLEKSLFKVMNNIVYGKTMEKLRRKRISVRLVNMLNLKTILNMLANQLRFLKNFLVKILLLFMKVLNLPIYVGFALFELSKYLLYDFHYNFIWTKFDADLLPTDTDSHLYEIKSRDVYEEF